MAVDNFEENQGMIDSGSGVAAPSSAVSDISSRLAKVREAQRGYESERAAASEQSSAVSGADVGGNWGSASTDTGGAEDIWSDTGSSDTSSQQAAEPEKEERLGATSTQDNENAKYAPPEITEANIGLGRKDVDFSPNYNGGWLNEKRNSPDQVVYEGHYKTDEAGNEIVDVDENGNETRYFISGKYEWMDDNITDTNLIAEFIKDGQFHTGEEINRYEQAAANLYYDYQTMSVRFGKDIDNMKTVMDTGTCDDESIQYEWNRYQQVFGADAEAQWAEHIKAAETDKAYALELMEHSKNQYDTLVQMNAYLAGYDDDKKIVEGSQEYKDYFQFYGVRTPEEIQAELEKYREIRDQQQASKSDLTSGGILGGSMAQMMSPDYGEDYKVSGNKAYMPETANEADIIIHNLEQELETAQAVESSITKHNKQLDVGRDYFLYTDPNTDWTKKEADLVQALDLATTEEQKQAIQDQLDYVHDIMDSNTQKEVQEAWEGKSLQEIDDRIFELEHDKQTKAASEADATRQEITDELNTINERIAKHDYDDEYKSYSDLDKKRKELQQQLNDLDNGKTSSREKEALPTDHKRTPQEDIEYRELLRLRSIKRAQAQQAEWDKWQEQYPDGTAALHWVEQAEADYNAAMAGGDIAVLQYLDQMQNVLDSYAAMDMENPSGLSRQEQALKHIDDWMESEEFTDDEKAVIEKLKTYIDEKGNLRYGEAAGYLDDYSAESRTRIDEARNELALAESYRAYELTQQPDYQEMIQKGAEALPDNYAEIITRAKNAIDATGSDLTGDAPRDILMQGGFTREEADALIPILATLPIDALTVKDKDTGWSKSFWDTLINGSYSTGAERGLFTEAQRNAFYYIYGKEGAAEAFKYAISINNSINRAYQDKIHENYMIVAEAQAARLGAVGSTLQALATPVVSSLEAMTGLVDAIRYADQLATVGGTYSSGIPSLATLGEWMDEKAIKGLQVSYDNWKSADFWYGVYRSSIQSLETIAVGGMLADIAGLTDAVSITALGLDGVKTLGAKEAFVGAFSDLTFFGSAFTDTYNNLTKSGIDPLQAAQVALASGVFEAGFEHWSIENLYNTKNVMDWGKGLGAVKDWLCTTLVQGGIEGSEELFTDLANFLSEEVLLGAQSDYQQNVARYMSEYRLSEKDAIRYANHGLALQLATSFAAGSLSGAAGAAFRGGTSYAQENSKEQKQYRTKLGEEYTKYSKDGKTAAQSVAEYLSNYEFVRPGFEDEFNESQIATFEAIKSLAEKVNAGTASNEEIGKMIQLADGYDVGLINDLAMTNKDLFMVVQPMRMYEAATAAQTRLLGSEEAARYARIREANPDSHVANDFESGLHNAMGENYDMDSANKIAAFVEQVVTGNKAITEQDIRDAFNGKELSDPAVQQFLLTYLQDEIKKARSSSVDSSGNPVIPTAEQAKAMQIQDPILAAMETPYKANNAEAQAKILEEAMVSIWSGVNEAEYNLGVKSDAFFSSLVQGAKEEQQAAAGSTETEIPFDIKDRSDDDTLTEDGVTVTRKQYLEKALKGLDPFTGKEVMGSIPTAEEINNIFDSKLVQYATSGQDNVSASMVNFDLQGRTSKEGKTVIPSAEQKQKMMEAQAEAEAPLEERQRANANRLADAERRLKEATAKRVAAQEAYNEEKAAADQAKKEHDEARAKTLAEEARKKSNALARAKKAETRAKNELEAAKTESAKLEEEHRIKVANENAEKERLEKAESEKRQGVIQAGEDLQDRGEKHQPGIPSKAEYDQMKEDEASRAAAVEGTTPTEERGVVKQEATEEEAAEVEAVEEIENPGEKQGVAIAEEPVENVEAVDTAAQIQTVEEAQDRAEKTQPGAVAQEKTLPEKPTVTTESTSTEDSTSKGQFSLEDKTTTASIEQADTEEATAIDEAYAKGETEAELVEEEAAPEESLETVEEETPEELTEEEAFEQIEELPEEAETELPEEEEETIDLSFKPYTPQEVRQMDLGASKDKDADTSSRKWTDEVKNGEQTVTRDQFVARVMSGQDGFTGEQKSAPVMSVAEANDLFDTLMVVEEDNGLVEEVAQVLASTPIKPNSAASKSSPSGVTALAIASAAQEVASTEAALEAATSSGSGGASNNTSGTKRQRERVSRLEQQLHDKRVALETLLGQHITDVGSAIQDAKAILTSRITALDIERDNVNRIIASGRRRNTEESKAFMVRRSQLTEEIRNSRASIKSLDAALESYNIIAGKLDTLRQQIQIAAEKKAAKTKGETNNGRSSKTGSSPSQRRNNVVATGSGTANGGNAQSGTAATGATETTGGQGTEQLSQRTLPGGIILLNGEVLFDSESMTSEDIENSDKLTRKEKDAILQMKRNGVEHIIITDGKLTNGIIDSETGQPQLIRGHVTEDGKTIVVNKRSGMYTSDVIMKHEFVHHMVKKMGVGEKRHFLNLAMEIIFSHNEKLYDKVMDVYKPGYAKAYGFTDEKGNAIENSGLIDAIHEEILADFYADIFNYGGSEGVTNELSEFRKYMNNAVRQYFERTGLEKFSEDMWKGADHIPQGHMDIATFASTTGFAFNRSYQESKQTSGQTARNSLESLTQGTNLEVMYTVPDVDGVTTFTDWLNTVRKNDPNMPLEDAQEKFREYMRTGQGSVVGVGKRGKNNTVSKLDRVTANDIKNSPLARLVTAARENGTIDAKEEARQLDFLAETVNLINNYKDADLVWEVMGSEMFAAIKANSDPQYGRTIDFSTICKKTQATIDAISKTMEKLGTGLSKEEIKYVYQQVGLADESTPCPVCYVFSRWMGLGSILDNINTFQDRYGIGKEADLTAMLERVYAATTAVMKETDLSFGKAINKAQGAVVSQISSAMNSLGLRPEALENIESLRAVVTEWQANYDNLSKTKKEKLQSFQNKLAKYEEAISRTEDEWIAEIDRLNSLADEFDAYKWAVYARVEENKNAPGTFTFRKNFKPVPQNVLFNLNRGEEFAKNYPGTWAYRTSRGSGLGKAILPYSDARVGETIQGVAGGIKTIKIGKKNPFMHESKMTSSAQKTLDKARKNMASQNLIGGMRYQSTSDFRYEYASDYLMTFFEMQAMGANVQLYTKVIEAVDFFAAVGCDVNLSVMPKNKGLDVLREKPKDWDTNYDRYYTLENGKYTKLQKGEAAPAFEPGVYHEIVYSDVTGVNGAAARTMVEKYDNVQMIMVGISANHINACLDSDDITFVIPFHGSGNTTRDIQELMNLLHEDISIEDIDDFSPYEEDHELVTSSPARDLRKKIVTGGFLDKKGNRIALNKDEYNILKGNPFLLNLFRRFYLDTMTNGVLDYTQIAQNYQAADLFQEITEDGRPKGLDFGNAQEFYKKYYLNGVNECYHTFPPGGKTANKIFPYEYWDKSLKQSEAKANGDAFQEYCASLGLQPRFSGRTKEGTYDADNDFTSNPNYWKLLIDRKMYDNNGNYRAQRKIDLTRVAAYSSSDTETREERFGVANLNPTFGEVNFGSGSALANEVNPGKKDNSVMSKVNDPKKTDAIAEKAAAAILEARAKNQDKYDRFATDEDIQQAMLAADPKLAAVMMLNDTGVVNDNGTLVPEATGKNSLTSWSQYNGIEDAAAEYFGTTDNYTVAGYMLKDGRMLDFSGNHYGGNYGRDDLRIVDHNDVSEAFDYISQQAPSDAARVFIERGNIRLSPEAPGINLYSKTEPTAEQYDRLRDFIQDRGTDGFYLDIMNSWTNHPVKMSYTEGTSPAKIINDIKNFYRTGVTPEQSTVNQFHGRYSLYAGINDLGLQLEMGHNTKDDFQRMFERNKEINFFNRMVSVGAWGESTKAIEKEFRKFVEELPNSTKEQLYKSFGNYIGGSLETIPYHTASNVSQKKLTSLAAKLLDILDKEVNKEYLYTLSEYELDEYLPEYVSAIEQMVDKDERGKFLDDDTWHKSHQALYDLFQKEPSLDYLRRLANETSKIKKDQIRKEFAYLLSKIDNADALWQLAAYSVYPSNGYWNGSGKAYSQADMDRLRSANRIFNNTIEKRREQILLNAGLSSNVKLEEREYSFQEIRDMFNKLNKDTHIAALADKVFPVAEKLGLTYRGRRSDVFDSDTNGHYYGSVVEYNINRFNDLTITDQRKASTLLHELIHACTSYAINAELNHLNYVRLDPNMRKAAQQLISIWDEISHDPDFKGKYGAKNPKEMIAELSNPKFRDALEQKNLWQRIVDAIKQFFGIDTKNALDATSVALDYMLNNVNYKAYLDYADHQNRAHDESGNVTTKAVNSTLNAMNNEVFNGQGVPGKFSIEHNIVDVNGNVYDTAVKLEYPSDSDIFLNSASFMDFFRKNMGDAQFTVYKDYEPEQVVFAREKDKVFNKETGNKYLVRNEFRYNTTPLTRLVILNADEAAQVSYLNRNRNTNKDIGKHGWLDANGWDYRNFYVITRNNIIAPATLYIAKARDGRNILYNAEVQIENGFAVDTAATARNAAAEPHSVPSTEVHTANPVNKFIPQTGADVNTENNIGQFSLENVPGAKADMGLNFNDPTGKLLERVFDTSDNRKKYETRAYNEKRGHGQIKGAWLNKPMGIVQTGAGPAQLVGYWELGDGELRDYEWLNEHAKELGNDGTNYEAKPGDFKWVYPIKWAERTDPQPVTSFGPQARAIPKYSLESPVDEYGNNLPGNGMAVDVTQSPLSDNLYYSTDGNTAYVNLEDGQTVVLNNVGTDSPEAQYIKSLEAQNNANSTNATTAKPYPIPPANRNVNNGYRLGEQNAGLRSGAQEVSEADQEGTLRRTGSIGERNEAGGSQSSQSESLNGLYSLIWGNDEVNEKGDPTRKIYNENGNIVTTEDAYPLESFERFLFKAMASGDYAGIEDVLNEYLDKKNGLTQEEADLLSNMIDINDAFTPEQMAAWKKALDEAVKKYGAMEPKGGDKNPDAVIPKKTDDGKKTRRFVRTVAANADNPILTERMQRERMMNALLGYTPMSNAASIEAAKRIIQREGGFDGAMAYLESVIQSGKVPTAADIALGDILIAEFGKDPLTVGKAEKIAAEMSVMSTNFGQIIQALSILKKLTPQGQLYYLEGVVKHLNKMYDKRIKDGKMSMIKINEALALQLRSASTEKAINDIVEAIKDDLAKQIPATWVDKWNAWRYLAMLGNPRTHIRNMIGNGAFMPAVFIKDMVARRLEQNKNWIDESARTKITGRSAAEKEAFRKYAEKDYKVMVEILKGKKKGNKFVDANDIISRRQIFDTAFLDSLEKFNGNALEAEDLWFMEKYYVRTLSEALQAKGVKMEDLKDSKFTESAKGKKILNEARAWAVREAQRDTYHDANAFAATLNELKRKNKVANVLLEGLVPFTKTPLNIMRRAIEYSPIGLISSAIDLRRELRTGNKNTTQIIDGLAAGLTGTGIMILGAFLAAMGILRGAGPDEDKEAEFEKLQGHQNWSIEFPWFGNKKASYTIDWMSPMALPLFVGGTFWDLLNGEVSLESAWDIGKALTTLADPMLAMSMLDGFENTLSSISQSNDASSISTLATSMVTSYLAQGMPTLFGQIARTIDDTRRSTYVDKNSSVPSGLQRFLQTSIMGKIPIVEGQKMAYVDAWGRTDTNDNILLRALENFVSPGYANFINETPVDAELGRLADAIGGKEGLGVLPNKANKSIGSQSQGKDDEGNEIKIDGKDLTAKEYEKYATITGQASYQLLAEVFATQEYQDATDSEKYDMVMDAFEYASSLAKQEIIPERNMDSKWMETAKDFGPADFIVIRQNYEDNKANDRIYDWIVSDPRLSPEQTAILLSDKMSIPNYVDDAETGYKFQLLNSDDAPLKDLYESMINEGLPGLYSSKEYIEADEGGKGALLQQFTNQTKAAALALYSETMSAVDHTRVLKNASSVGKQAFDMVLDTNNGDPSKQAEWLWDYYRPDKTIANPDHPGYVFELGEFERGTEGWLRDEGKTGWIEEYNKVLNSKEFKAHSGDRDYQNDMIEDAFYKYQAKLEDQYARELAKSGAVETFTGKPTGYKTAEAFDIAVGQYGKDYDKIGMYVAQTQSMSTAIKNPDKPGYFIVLSTAQQNQGEALFNAMFTEDLKNNRAYIESLPEEKRGTAVKDLMDQTKARFDEQYGRQLANEGYAEQEIRLDGNTDEFNQLLANEHLSKEQTIELLVQKYAMNQDSDNWEAKDFKVNLYREYIEQVFDSRIKEWTPQEFEKLRSSYKKDKGAAYYVNEAVKKLYGVKNQSSIPLIEYNQTDISGVSPRRYTPETSTTTSTGKTPMVIPPNNKQTTTNKSDSKSNKLKTKYRFY